MDFPFINFHTFFLEINQAYYEISCNLILIFSKEMKPCKDALFRATALVGEPGKVRKITNCPKSLETSAFYP